jgi:hypothetical protein
MNDATRRGFLVMTGAGAAAVATAGAVALANNKDSDAAQPVNNASGPLVAWVADAGGSEVTIMVGEREVVVTDADLVARLARASVAAEEER